MELQIECFKEMEENYHSNNAKLEKFYNDNIIDSDGEIRASSFNIILKNIKIIISSYI